MLVNGSIVSVPACSPSLTDCQRCGVAPTGAKGIVLASARPLEHVVKHKGKARRQRIERDRLPFRSCIGLDLRRNDEAEFELGRAHDDAVVRIAAGAGAPWPSL